MYNTSEIHRVPDENDLNRAASAIHRLQKVYDIKTNEMSKGYLNEINYKFET